MWIKYANIDGNIRILHLDDVICVEINKTHLVIYYDMFKLVLVNERSWIDRGAFKDFVVDYLKENEFNEMVQYFSVVMCEWENRELKNKEVKYE